MHRRITLMAVIFTLVLGCILWGQAGGPLNAKARTTAGLTTAGNTITATSTIALTIDPATDPDGAAQELISAINQANADPDPTTIQLKCGTYSYSTPNNYEYGPNALPPITSEITIEGKGAVLDSTAPVRLRFLYVSGGLSYNAVTTQGLSRGTLTLRNLTLSDGKQKGGEAFLGGGGAGMGGAIFNQGDLTLDRVTMNGNTATGGSSSDLRSWWDNPNRGGGGMGQDAQGINGGGFGGPPLGAGGSGGNGSPMWCVFGQCLGGSSGGGGGFRPEDTGANAFLGGNGGNGGGQGLLGGNGGNDGGTKGDGGGGGRLFSRNADGGAGGSYGNGGVGGNSSGGKGGGGGVGGGGGGGGLFGVGGSSGGGGFGGGGGNDGAGGFGGGGGGFGFDLGGDGGFGGGLGGGFDGAGGGGGGLGGAIFNHRGTLTIINSTLTGNSAQGGTGGTDANGGSGLGGAIFNLNGTVSINFSTIAKNTVTAGSSGPFRNPGLADGGELYNLAFGNTIEGALASTAMVTLRNSIVSNSTGGNDVVNDKRDGASTNTATVDYDGRNIVMTKSALTGTAFTGTLYSTADPQLGTPTASSCQPGVLPIASTSPALDVADCDSVNAPTDELGTPRPQGAGCDLGAYEACQPALTLKPNISIWPHNHQYRTFTIADMVDSVSDNCSSLSVNDVVIEKVTSDEPNNAKGDRNTTDDIVVEADCNSVQLRAERDGTKNGRVYVVTLLVKDASGNATRADFKVSVPISQNGTPAVQDASAQTVTGGCP